MALIVKLAGTGESRRLASGTLSIGRSESNGWVLPDPERHLSKTHCVISVEGDRWVLTDLSTNGVFVNGAAQPTARDSRVVLTDGDGFRVGEYSFTVEEGAAGPVAAAAEPGPLDVDPLDDPLGAPTPLQPNAAFSHPVRHQAPTQRMNDPFDQADAARHRVAADLDLFRGPAPLVEWKGPSQADNADAPRHAMPVAKVLAPVNPSEIDFDALIGDLSGFPGAQPAAPAPAPVPAPSAAPSPAPANPFDTLDALIMGQPAHVAAPPPQAAAPSSREPDAAAAPPVQAPPQGAAPAETPGGGGVAPDVAPGLAMAAALRIFLEGAGVGHLPPASDPEAALRLAGEVFRTLTEGLREVLMSRATVKGELRVEQTMIKAAGNNPLKFSITPEDAVLALLSSGRPGYMPAITAAREAFDDIKTHELAVMAGVQTALVSLLRRFDPDALEARLVQGILATVLPATRKARLWENFRDTYKTIATEAEDDFQAVFGRAFAKAYMAQARK